MPYRFTSPNCRSPFTNSEYSLMQPNKLLFLAGESGVGKTTLALRLTDRALILHSDGIMARAGPVYFRRETGQFCSWKPWAIELDDQSKHFDLVQALRLSLTERRGEPIHKYAHLIVEGAIAGHSSFRALLQQVLETEYSLTCHDETLACFWLCPSVNHVYRQILNRARKADARVTLSKVRRRRQAYIELMSPQPVERFTCSESCYQAACRFFRGSSLLRYSRT